MCSEIFFFNQHSFGTSSYVELLHCNWWIYTVSEYIAFYDMIRSMIQNLLRYDLLLLHLALIVAQDDDEKLAQKYAQKYALTIQTNPADDDH